MVQDTVEFEIESQDQPLTTKDNIPRKIFTATSDPTIKDLHERHKDGDLDLQPDFQRQFVWDYARASKLIESVLLDVPLPVIYLAEENDGTESVIDGQQRLTSFFAFIDGDFPISGLVVRSDIVGLRFSELPPADRNAIKKASLRTITIKKESDHDLKFEIFERLNSGSVALNDQELRNCVYRGPYIRLLKELSRDADFCKLLNFTAPDKRMRDVELVLRFASFYHATYINYNPPMKTFMNTDMKQFKDMTLVQQDALRMAFKKSCQLVYSLFGEHSFKRFYRGSDDQKDGRWELKKINSSLYDVLMFGFIPYEKPQIHAKLDSIREAFINLMSSHDGFIAAIELSTSSKQAIEARFDLWRHTLKAIMFAEPVQVRCFTWQLKDQLFKENPVCAICNQKIVSIDDSAVDHVEQYWLGGKTIAENARLTHRYCNWSRPRGKLGAA